MKIRIKKAGLMATVQDLGRSGYLSQGVPLSGAMDRLSAQLANLAVGNKPGDAVIEFTNGGAVFETEADCLIAFCGDGARLKTTAGQLPCDRPIFVPSGAVITLENNLGGCFSYLAVAGAWDLPEALGSRSTYITAKIGGLEGRCLKENDVLVSTDNLNATAASLLSDLKGEDINSTVWSIARDSFLPADRKIIRAVRGAEFSWFDERSTQKFFSQTFTIGNNSNRMGYQLMGEPINRATEKELLSTAVAPGTNQVTNSGEVILLMADCQTTGGYPRIAQVAAVDLPLCAQLKPGDSFNFKEISWKEAEKLYIQQQQELRRLQAAIKLRYI